MNSFPLRRLFCLLFPLLAFAAPGGAAEEPEPDRILVFSKTAGFRHASIEAGLEALRELAEQHGVAVEATENAAAFTPENLALFAAVVFLNTSGTLFDEDQRAALKGFIRGGGGYVGVHAASDTEYDWPWYEELVGAWFHSHPNNPNVRPAVAQVEVPDHPATAMLPARWPRNDEWYNFRRFADGLTVLLTLDTDSYEGSRHPGNHPISWCREFEGGRSFYTAFGHTSETFREDLFRAHLWGGIAWAMGRAD
ncbi:MAG: ThuA domain-containing protein [Puniceicoccaceae bacterium]|nr:MAG: ThuA domain-containing protein [Puniceicoccaceae bacterium]